MEKVAYGAFSDINFVAAVKKRGFCRLLSLEVGKIGQACCACDGYCLERAKETLQCPLPPPNAI